MAPAAIVARVANKIVDMAEMLQARATILVVETLGILAANIDARIQMSNACSWDRVGLQVGDPEALVGAVGVCHEVTERVISEAAAQNINALVAYHPLLFRPTTSFISGTSAPGRAYSLAAAGIGLYVVHTAFDVAPGGTADALAESLGLRDARGFGLAESDPVLKIVVSVSPEAVEHMTSALATAGVREISGVDRRGSEARIEMLAPASREEELIAAILSVHPHAEPVLTVADVRGSSGMIGRIGEIEPQALASLVGMIGKKLDTSGIRVAGEPDRQVERVAVVPGSGTSLIAQAVAAGAEVLVTGDISHHAAVDARSRAMALIDAGHAPTERPGMAALVEVIGQVSDMVVDLTGVSTDPWSS